MFHSRKNHVSPEGRSISVTFYLKPLKKRTTESSIMARIIFGRKKAELATGIRIPDYQISSTQTWNLERI